MWLDVLPTLLLVFAFLAKMDTSSLITNATPARIFTATIARQARAHARHALPVTVDSPQLVFYVAHLIASTVMEITLCALPAILDTI